MIQITRNLLMFTAIILVAISCKKNGDDIKPSPPLPPEIEFNAEPKAALLDLAQIIDPDDLGRQLYSARYMLEVSGLPFFETSDLTEALKASLILISSPIDVGMLTTDQINLLTNWTVAGGVIIAPVCEDPALQSLFGFSGSPNYTKTRYRMNWTDEVYPELSYFDHDNEKTISLGKESIGKVLKSYGYSLDGTSVALAYFDSHEVAVIRNVKGAGRTYLFGLEWRDVIQRPQLNRDFEAQRVYANWFEPSADVFPLFVRSVWTDMQPVSVWKHTIPEGFKTVLMPTHDVDATSGYELMSAMSDYEKSLGLNAMFFITTRYFGDEIANKPYYNEKTIGFTKGVIASGHTLGSHSVGHFPDFSKDSRFPLGSTSVTMENYNPRHVNGKTVDATTYGEIKVSKDLIEDNLNVNIRSFRPGHLLNNSFVAEGLASLGYSFHSSFTAGDVLTGYPFFERFGYDWKEDLSPVLQIPIHISDGDITRDNYPETADIWFDVLSSLQDNYTPCVLLIHPTRNWKRDALEALVDQLNLDDCGLYNMEAYGDFWKARSDFEFEFDYQEEEQRLIIKASSAGISKAATVGVMVESKLPVASYYLVDADFTEYPISVKSFGDGRNLILIQ